MTPKALKSQTVLRVAIVLVILVLLNIVSIRVFGRLDFTRNGLFTLSDASKELVGSLDDMVTVRAYFTEDLPAPYNFQLPTITTAEQYSTSLMSSRRILREISSLSLSIPPEKRGSRMHNSRVFRPFRFKW
jgi:hypothetical protein